MNEELMKKAYDHFGGVWPYGDDEVMSVRVKAGWSNIYSNGDKEFLYNPDWRTVGTKADFDAYSEGLRSSKINWDEAPEGATAYCDGAGYPWMMTDGDEFYYYSTHFDDWTKYIKREIGQQYYNDAVKKPQGESIAWQPKVGEECEAAWGLTPDMWGSAVYIGDYFLFEFEKGKFMKMEIKGLKNLRFRPIKTERDKFVEYALDNVVIPCNLDILKQYLSDLYDAGYRKTEEEK